MTKNKIWFLLVVAFFVASLGNAEAKAQTSSVFSAGFKFPQKIIYAPQPGIFLVSEAGIPSVPNNGRVSIVTNDGSRYTLIDGLPSGPVPPGGEPSGPSALWLDGNSLYIAIGNGNATLNGPAPGSEIPNPNPNSPIFSSVLELRFPSNDIQARRLGFELSFSDHVRLANGETLVLGGFGQESATLRLAANFPDFTPEPRPDVPNNVRPSNPFGLVGAGDKLYVVDAAQNHIRTVFLRGGFSEIFLAFPPRANPLPFGPPFIDSVPDSLRLVGNRLLVTFLTGFPFPPGVADVRQIDLESGAQSQLIGGLTTAIDVLPVNESISRNSFYTLEFSTNMLTGAPGRLQRFDLPGGQPIVISNTLVSPTSMAQNPSGDLFVTEIFPGRITRISNAP